MKSGRRSIIRTYVLSLFLLLLAAVILIASVSLYFSAKDAEQDIANHSTDIVQALTQVLATPLWNFDENAISLVCDAYVKNEFIRAIVVTDHNDNRIYNSAGDQLSGPYVMSRDIYFKERFIGRVTLQADEAYRDKLVYKYLWPYLVSNSLMIAVTVLFSVVFMRFVLQKPFQWLTDMASSFSIHGDTKPVVSDPYEEFQTLVKSFDDMKHTINDQFDELIRNRDYLQLIMNSVADVVISFNEKGVIEFWNPAAELVLGYNSKEFSNCPIESIVPRLTPGALQMETGGDLGWVGAPSNRFAAFDGDAVRSGERVFPAEIALTEFSISGKRMYTLILKDISQKKMIEKQKDEFISTLNHELRTPLTSIVGSLSIIHGVFGETLNSEVVDMVSVAQRNADRLQVLINDLLDIQKMEAGGVSLNFTRLDLRELVKEAALLNESMAGASNISLDVVLGSKALWVKGDKERLIQVISNLISNAVKFSSEGGVVIIDARTHEKNRIKVSVSDNGVGVPVEYRKRIFQRFSQADSSDSRSRSGTGLGLYICKSVVRAHDGEIDYFSVRGNGSTFFFILPEYGADSKADKPPRYAVVGPLAQQSNTSIIPLLKSSGE
ncbi:MAG: PAS domain-containing sensor histidine kinase [Gammaproteobacteria bacterium]|nr:PAS domain-containing sensor histidine kinase [Gammaproteobacteria bacterium]